MPNVTRQLLSVTLASLLGFAGCDRAAHRGFAPDVRRELHAGAASLDALVDSTRAGYAIDDASVITLGYAERLRLGLGSPFRLAEAALNDPRLDDNARRRTAWALLARTLDGDAYEVDPVSLDRAGMAGIASWPGLGEHHLYIIEHAITSARDPRSGEMAVRLGYQQAVMEHSVSPHAPVHAARVAALLRDRELAKRDVARLLRSAEAVQGDPLGAIPRWRAEHWLEVEAPPLAAVGSDVEEEALALAPSIVERLRVLGPRIGDLSGMRAERPAVRRTLLTNAVARRLASIADSMHAPPQAPVAIAARAYSAELVSGPWLTARDRSQRRLFSGIGDEEAYAAAYAQLTRLSPHDAAPSLSAVSAAVGLRAFAQEPVWFVGDGGPSTREIIAEFGLRAVRFSSDVPSEWRPYYRSMLQLALRDMRSVLPALDVKGLAIEFRATPRGNATLAMHDPKARRLILPPSTAAGTIAHEIAHDVDWQVALRRYHVRGDYATDRAARTNSGLALNVRRLTPDGALAYEARDAHARRPAENFARAIDWFVATSLAADGRSNGYLTSIQDEVLTGYGTVRPPDVTGRAGDALISILDEVLPPTAETRATFLASYGTGRTRTALDLVRSLTEIRVPPAPRRYAASSYAGAGYAGASHAADSARDHDAVADAMRSIDATRRLALAAIEPRSCSIDVRTELQSARHALVKETAAARARGVALRYAQRIGGEAGSRWVARRFYGALWPADEIDQTMARSLDEVVNAAQAVAGIGASHAVDVCAPDYLVKLDLVADGQAVLEHPFRKLTEVGTLPYR